MLSRLSIAAIASTALTTSTGCPLVELEIEVNSVCATVPGIQIDGVPAIPSSDGVVQVEQSVDVTDQAKQISESLAELGVTATVQLVSLDALIDPGPDTPAGFEFIERMKVVARSPGTGLEPIVLLECDDCSGDAAGVGVAIDPVEMMQYIESAELILDVSIRGRMPEQSWSMSMDMCFDSTAHYSYEYER